MSNETEIPASVSELIRRKLITKILRSVKSGKEGTVYCCAAHSATGYQYLALKAYRPLIQRAFRHDSVYQLGRVIEQSRRARAFAMRSTFGLKVRALEWIEAEYRTLSLLHSQGARVPRPIARVDGTLLMEFIGEDPRGASTHHRTTAPV